MNKTGRIVFGIALVALILCLGCQAKDYAERIGPYEVSFKLPDNIASEMNLNKTSITNVTTDGISYDTNAIEFQTQAQGSNQIWNGLVVTHFNKTRDMDIESIKGGAKLDGTTCNSAHQIIDGHEGVIISCYGSQRNNEDYRFMYQLDNRTIVNGVLSLDWDTVVLPFLRSLHVKEVD
jgi:hypothetical protein